MTFFAIVITSTYFLSITYNFKFLKSVNISIKSSMDIDTRAGFYMIVFEILVFYLALFT